MNPKKIKIKTLIGKKMNGGLDMIDTHFQKL